MTNVEINGKEYPIEYSLQAMFWFADWLGIPMEDVGEVMEKDMTDLKGYALMYSGVVAGSEKKKGRKPNISFSEFQGIVAFDEELSGALGTLFQKEFQETVSELQAKAEAKKLRDKGLKPAAKKKGKRLTSD